MTTSDRQLSVHLKLSELDCHDGTPYPVEWIETRALQLAVVFELIRAIWNKPITVGSGYRTQAYNDELRRRARLAGTALPAKYSQHIDGRAMDLYPPKGVSIKTFLERIHALALREDNEIRGFGQYAGFAHVDIRPTRGDRLVVWRGSRAWPEVKGGK